MSQITQKQGEEHQPLLHADLEARVVVLEIIAMTSLAMALDTPENDGAQQAHGIGRLILETVTQRCQELGMTQASGEKARSYADELLSTALQSLYPEGS